MTDRRAHIVRSEFTGEAQARVSTTGCTILCCVGTGQELALDETVLLGPIPVTVTDDYARVFIAATVNGIMEADGPDPDPDPPGPGSWTVTFVYGGTGLGETFVSGVFNPSLVGEVTCTGMEWEGWPEHEPFSPNGIQESPGLDVYFALFDLWDSGSDDFSGSPVLIDNPIRMYVVDSDDFPAGPCNCTLFLTSPFGADQVDVIL